MIKFFRHIRQSMINQNRTKKYLLYAIGEIILVVIGILIALQINNWNEDQKSRKDERYVLTEVLKNLEEDAILVKEIIAQRQKAKTAIIELQKFVSSESKDTDSLKFYLVDILTFERYFPINNAYEILKSKGLQLSNNELTTEISRYYDYEQPKMSNSILDIEVTILKVFNDRNGLVRFLSLIEKDEQMVVKNPNDPNFIEELSFFLIAFQDNNGGTLNKLLVFEDINNKLREQIMNGLKKLS
ncbi:DUF6090 family protein [Winogradskyella ouciana]|uniref:Uncharacterized protein n=1 Tax=Winogradskyella ouciana TaxID=2608631 RepID=A0A7K1GFI1_9FLAO|nr:DUF6090 family protein [Winogradskyella ouciana]MTE27873.1 hypothetical protein [Winogradskyella ouciana]